LPCNIIFMLSKGLNAAPVFVLSYAMLLAPLVVTSYR
jgi:hypothetical protein